MTAFSPFLWEFTVMTLVAWQRFTKMEMFGSESEG